MISSTKKTLLLALFFTFLAQFLSFPKNVLFKRVLRGPSLPSPMQDLASIKDRVTENFHTVEKNKLYRSAQLSPDALKKYVKKRHIKTVINLRGSHPNEHWWEQEKAVCANTQIKFCNISMSASSMPNRQNLIDLLQIYDTGPYPILIHCYGGADRTGEAAALWRLEKQGHSHKQATQELSPLYGHFKSRYPAKDFLIKIWGGRTWLKQRYNPAHYPQFNRS